MPSLHKITSQKEYCPPLLSKIIYKSLFNLECKLSNHCNKTNFDINQNSNKLYFDELVKYGKNFVENFEINLNLLLKEIRDERKEDKKTFDKVIKDIKIYYKMIRQKSFEQSLIDDNQMKKIKTFEKQNEIKILYRKDEPPYYKKRKPKVVIDYDLIRDEENKELMTYH